MSIKLTDFKAAVRDVCRPNRYQLSIGGAGSEGAGGWTETKTFLCKSAQLPSRTLGQIELNWQGMKTKIAGDPTFDDISVTFLADVDFEAKNFFEQWVENISNMASNERSEHQEYKADVTLEQLGRTGEILASYILIGCYPTSLDAVELSTESNDTPMEFTVNLTYDFFRRSDSSGISTEV
ncbi:hypothetical protein GW796_05615 [archaeon]|nr:hypothetical protein [archaeon]NCQ51362.1 hypothetical protein [archaeon]NCT58812.1 hypothetical protein [archaeon]